jgi:hypothetical protein
MSDGMGAEEEKSAAGREQRPETRHQKPQTTDQRRQASAGAVEDCLIRAAIAKLDVPLARPAGFLARLR